MVKFIIGVINVVVLFFFLIEDNVCDLLDFVVIGIKGILDVILKYGKDVEWLVNMFLFVVIVDIFKGYCLGYIYIDKVWG